MQGSAIGAEQRIQAIELRCEQALGPIATQDSHQRLSKGLHKNFKEPDFRAVASMMQNQMYAANFSKDEDDKSSINNIFDMTMMQETLGVPLSEPFSQSVIPNPPESRAASLSERTMLDSQNKTLLGISATLKSELLAGAGAPELADMPVEGRISSFYGDRSHPLSGHHHFHNGLDIAAPLGTEIKAPWEGKVVYVGQLSGFGSNTVIMEHPNTLREDGKLMYSVFGHNQSVSVKTGDLVPKGESFATVGSEGRSTGPHLHWETRLAKPGLKAKDLFKQEISMTVDPLKFV